PSAGRRSPRPGARRAPCPLGRRPRRGRPGRSPLRRPRVLRRGRARGCGGGARELQSGRSERGRLFDARRPYGIHGRSSASRVEWRATGGRRRGRKALMDLGLEGKTVIVTGGSGGIGRGLVLCFAEEGSHVVVATRDATQGQKVVDAAKELPG